jgi:CRP-like cAMP-binding protein
VKDGEVGETLFIILSGVASVEKNGVELTKLRQGDIIGEFILLNELTRTADIFAHQELTVLSIENSTIFELYRTNPKIFAILMLNLSRRLMEKLKFFSNKTKELSNRIDELEGKEAA